MRTLLVIGIGAGDPEHMTVQAINALNRADVVFVPRKAGKDGLADARREILSRYMTRPAWRLVEYDVPVRAAPEPSYGRSVDDWHDAIEGVHQRLLRDELGEDQCGAFLVWGDPSIYDSTLRIVDRLKAHGGVTFDHEVFPGITSIQALAAHHRLALNTIGGPIHVTTGRLLAGGMPENADSVVVMLDGQTAFSAVEPEGVDIFWGANIGTRDEAFVAGPLTDKAEEIAATRAAVRDKAGWVMDTYLLRKKPRD